MTAKLAQTLNNPNSAVNLLGLCGDIEAALTAWTAGDYLYDNGRGGAGFIKRLEPPPPEIWEIRVTNPGPSARIFGRFAEPDTFIATDIYTRAYLRRKKSRAWLDACNQCAADWASILPMFPPFRGSVVADYITEDCDDFPLP